MKLFRTSDMSVMPPHLIGGALSDTFVWRLTSVCRVYRA